MKRRTTELIRKALGEDSDAPNRVKKTFTTGKDIEKECEEIEHIIERDGEDAFMEAIRARVKGGRSSEGVSEGPARDHCETKSDSET